MMDPEEIDLLELLDIALPKQNYLEIGVVVAGLTA